MNVRGLSGTPGVPGWRLIASGFGLLFSVLLFPKVTPIWLLQFAWGAWSVLYAHAVQLLCFFASKEYLLYWAANRQWITGAVFAGGYVREAIDEIDDEREFTAAERDAFEAFADEVESMSVTPRSSTGSPPAALAGRDVGADSLETVRERYRETVMSVPGYETVYGEPFVENAAAEFGEDLAAMVDGDTGLTPPVRALLVRQSSASALERERHLEALATERRSVVNARSRLRELESVVERTDPRGLHRLSFEELLEHEADLADAVEECERLLADRQREIHANDRRMRRAKGTLLQEYLYRPLDTPLPVVSSVLEGIQALSDRRRAVTRSIARRY